MGDPTYATEERLWEFQTRLIENVDKCKEAFKKNDPDPGTASRYKTINGTIPATMTVPVRNMLSGDDNEVQHNMTGSTPCVLSEEDHGELHKFVNLPASIVQLLTPRIEVYKIYKAPEGSTEKDRAYLLHQGKHKKSDILASLAEGDVTLHDNNMQGVVLQSVDFTKLGGNPAEVHTNIKFNMRLYAKNITEFFVRTDSYPDTLDSNTDTDAAMEEWFEYLATEASTANEELQLWHRSLKVMNDRGYSQATIDEAQQLIEDLEADIASDIATHRAILQETTDVKGTAWIDIIKIDPGQSLGATGTAGAPTQPTTVNSNLTVEERDVRIKVDIGYAFEGKKPTDITQEAWVHWKAEVDKQKEVFFLSLKKHEFSFLGMSGVELSVDFVASGNAKALQPSYDVLGSLDYERFLNAHQVAFTAEDDNRTAWQEQLALLQEQLAENETFLVGAEADLVVAKANTNVYTTVNNLSVGTFSFRLDVQNVGYIRRKSIERDKARTISSFEQTILNLNNRIETCSEKIEEINKQEQERNIEATRTKTNIRSRVLKQLYLVDIASMTFDETRVHTVETTALAAAASNFRPSTETTQNHIHLVAALGEDSASQSDRNSDRDTQNVLTRLTGDSDVMTNGGFVFLADIFEAAYEAILLQVVNTAGVANIPELVAAVEEAEALERQRLRNDMQAQMSSSPQYDAAHAAANTARQSLLNARNPRLEPFATMSATDFKSKVLSHFDGIVTGNVTIQHPKRIDETITMPISDIPIAIDLFRVWFTRESRARVQYPLRDFIPDVMKFVEDMFGKIKYRDGTVARNVKSYDLPRFALNSVSFASKAPFLLRRLKHTSRSASGIARIIAYSKNSDTQRTATVIEQVHVGNMSNAGVPKLIFGQATKGILKQISFEREDIPGHAEARLMTDRDSVSSNIALREKYNVSIETRGTTSFLPGSTFYLDITPLELGYTSEENSYAKRLGLGGMYRVVTVESTIAFDGGGNSWTTKLKTKWESFGDGTNGDPNQLGASSRRAECQ
jgi:hypothetical protein